MHIWHFVEEEGKTPHVLRPNADPTASYVDGRCQELYSLIEKMGEQLRDHNKDTWMWLNQMTWKIFKHKHDERHKKEEDLKEQPEQM